MLKKTLLARPVTYCSPRDFARTLKLLAEKLKASDWSSLNTNVITQRASRLRSMLPIAVALAKSDFIDKEPLKVSDHVIRYGSWAEILKNLDALRSSRDRTGRTTSYSHRALPLEEFRCPSRSSSGLFYCNIHDRHLTQSGVMSSKRTYNSRQRDGALWSGIGSCPIQHASRPIAAKSCS